MVERECRVMYGVLCRVEWECEEDARKMVRECRVMYRVPCCVEWEGGECRV